MSELGGEHLGHPVVFDIPAERVEPDFCSVKFDRTRRKERARVVDEAQRPERRSLGPQSGAKAEGVEKSDRPVEEGDGAPASGPLPGAAQDDVEARARKAQGGREPGEPRPGDQDVRSAPGRRLAVGHR